MTRIADEKARCAADLAGNGESFARVAGLLSVGTRSRAQQLVGRGRRLPGVIFAFRDQDGEFYGDEHLLATTPHEKALLQFEPADRDLFFAGHLLHVYFGHVDEDTVTPACTRTRPSTPRRASGGCARPSGCTTSCSAPAPAADHLADNTGLVRST